MNDIKSKMSNKMGIEPIKIYGYDAVLTLKSEVDL